MIKSNLWRPYAPPRLPTPALVTDIELAHSVAPLITGPAYRAARVLVRLHSRPIGYADICVSPGDVIDRARILAALDSTTTARALHHLAADLAAQNAPALPAGIRLPEALALAESLTCQHLPPLDGPALTIAVCTRDRADLIGDTLASLEAQTYRNREILVLDNAPRNAATMRLVQTRFPRVRYVCESRPGLDWARNRAIQEARGEMIAFIDDDVTADPQWAQALIAGFESPDVMCVTGLVAPASLETAAEELFERFGYSKAFEHLTFKLSTPPPIPIFPYKGYLGTGCNSVFRRSVFDHVGLFDTCLDMGTPVPGGGDLDMFARIIRAGYSLVYDPSPVVYHKHVADMAALIDKMGQYQRASIAYFTKCILTDRDRAPELIAHVIYAHARKTIRGLTAAVLKRDRPLALVIGQAVNAWLGPVALYRSYRRAKAASRDVAQDDAAAAL